MARWMVQVLAMPEETVLSEEMFETGDAARDFAVEVMGEWDCECVLTDSTGEAQPQRFRREPMIGRYDDWD